MSSAQFLVDADPAWCEEATQVAVKSADAVSRYKSLSETQRANLKRAVGIYAVARADALKNALAASHAHAALLGWINTSPPLAVVLRVLHESSLNPSEIPSWTGPTRTTEAPKGQASIAGEATPENAALCQSNQNHAPHECQGSLFG